MQAISRIHQRALLWACAMVFAAGLAGCHSEANDRKAFAAFLQTRIIDKPGIHVPRLTPQEEKSFGQYSTDFAVIRDFNSALDTRVGTPMQAMMAKGMPRSIGELMSRRADLATLRQTSATLRTSIDTELTKADAAHAALKQPDDLKAVYDKAYARTVTNPAVAIKDVLPAVESMLTNAEKLATYLDAHKEAVQINGNSVQVTDPKVLAEANVLMEQMNAKGKEILDGQRKLQALMVSGS